MKKYIDYFNKEVEQKLRTKKMNMQWKGTKVRNRLK